MTVRDELVELLKQGVNVPAGSSYIFLRDHGPALLEALDTAGAVNWLTEQAGCNLISDDDGRWAVSTSGCQPVPECGGFTEPVAITSFVEPDEWKTSIVEAIDRAMEEV